MTQSATKAVLEPRLRNAAELIPQVAPAIQTLVVAAHSGGVPHQTLDLVHLRVSQINGCSVCVDSGVRMAKRKGVSEALLFAATAWRHSPLLDDAERAALALAEAVTRLADAADPVPDAVWSEAARHYDDKQLATLLLWISLTNLFNRLNVSTAQVAGPQEWETQA